MARRVSATQARIRFGELMRRAVEDKEAIIVERGGKPYVVLVSVEEYNRLKRGQAASGWEELLGEIRRVRAPLVGRPLPPPEEVIRELREERGERLTDLR